MTGVIHDAVTHSVRPYPSLMTVLPLCVARNSLNFFSRNGKKSGVSPQRFIETGVSRGSV